jgi:hypothetical protein
MTELVKSRWQYGNRSQRVDGLLDSLGIRYRQMAGQDFWQANKEHLAVLYHELQVEARNRIRELHPDNGGDGYAFSDFVSTYKKVLRQFVRYGATSLLQSQIDEGAEVLTVRSGQFRNPGRAIEMMKLILTGVTDSEVVRRFSSSLATAAKVRRAIGRVCFCECGRPGNHRGWCEARPHPNRQGFQRLGRKPGFKIDAETKAKMSLARTGKHHTAQSRRRIGDANRLHHARNPQPRIGSRWTTWDKELEITA